MGIVAPIVDMPISNGLYYFFYEGGEAGSTPVILLHGSGGTHLSWPPEIRRLGGFNVYAVDLPGHGKSEGYGEQSIELYAKQVVDWMHSLEMYRVFVIGHSLGGAIALEIARMFPKSVPGLGLIGVGARLQIPIEILDHLINPVTVQAALNQVTSLSFCSETNPRLVELFSKQLTKVRPGVLRGDFLASQEFNVTDKPMNVTIPTIIIAGAQDKIVPLSSTQLIVSQFSQGELSVIPDAGHMLMLEKPREVSHRLFQFLGRQRFFR